MDDKKEADSVRALCKCVLGFRRWHQSWARPVESREREASNVSEPPVLKPVSKNNQLRLRVVDETSHGKDCRLGIIEVGTVKRIRVMDVLTLREPQGGLSRKSNFVPALRPHVLDSQNRVNVCKLP